ncbi:hypothetical protein ACQCVE_09815 [Metabacillus sp. 113a]|uniref:hypothetical protein n=1 Tax=Metabacillus sp. 113a TaxID=3404706 RepID=UPI003CF1DAD9
MKNMWLLIGLVLALCLPGFVSAAQGGEEGLRQHERFKSQKQQELMGLVRTYTPEKVREWEAALKERDRIKQKLHKDYKKDRMELLELKKSWKEQNLSDAEIRRNVQAWRKSKQEIGGHHRDRKKAAQELKHAIERRDEGEIKQSLNDMLKRIQRRNTELEKR